MYNNYDYTLKNAKKVIFAKKLSYNLLVPGPRYDNPTLTLYYCYIVILLVPGPLPVRIIVLDLD